MTKRRVGKRIILFLKINEMKVARNGDKQKTIHRDYAMSRENEEVVELGE